MGEVFAGRYELLDLIGEGGMGTIWVALDRKTNGLVAAKVLRQSDAGTLLRFVREQSVRIHDPNVLTPLGWAGEDDRVLFTMPIIRGGSVATLVGDHGPLPPHLVAELLRQTLSGLAAVHAADIVHRDIKPANILLDATGTGRPRAYVSDFGIAVDINAPRWTETGFISGTPGYLAPELESFGTLSPATDLYAVGQVALTMLTSQGPAERVGSGRPVGCPESLWSVVSALVAPDPVDRPESARAALEALSVPELDWRPDAMGEVEIFDQVVSDGPEVTRPKVHRRTPPGPQVFDAAEQPRHSGTTPGPARRGGLGTTAAFRNNAGGRGAPGQWVGERAWVAGAELDRWAGPHRGTVDLVAVGHPGRRRGPCPVPLGLGQCLHVGHHDPDTGNDTDGCLTEPEHCAYPLSESGLGDGGSRRPVRRAALRVRRGRRSREDRGWDGRDVPAPAERDLRVGGSLSATAPHGIPDPAEHGEGEQSATDEREHRSVVRLDWLLGVGRRSGR